VGNAAPNHGGGFYALNSSFILRDCDIHANTANVGAGLACQGGGTPRLERCAIGANEALGSSGGVLSEEGCQLTLIECIVEAPASISTARC